MDKWDAHEKAEREGGKCPHCGDTFPAPGRLQVIVGHGGVVVLTETDGPQNLEVKFAGESVTISVIDGDDETVVSIPRHAWDRIVGAGH